MRGWGWTWATTVALLWPQLALPGGVGARREPNRLRPPGQHTASPSATIPSIREPPGAPRVASGPFPWPVLVERGFWQGPQEPGLEGASLGAHQPFSASGRLRSELPAVVCGGLGEIACPGLGPPTTESADLGVHGPAKHGVAILGTQVRSGRGWYWQPQGVAVAACLLPMRPEALFPRRAGESMEMGGGGRGAAREEARLAVSRTPLRTKGWHPVPSPRRLSAEAGLVALAPGVPCGTRNAASHPMHGCSQDLSHCGPCGHRKSWLCLESQNRPGASFQNGAAAAALARPPEASGPEFLDAHTTWLSFVRQPDDGATRKQCRGRDKQSQGLSGPPGPPGAETPRETLLREFQELLREATKRRLPGLPSGGPLAEAFHCRLPGPVRVDGRTLVELHGFQAPAADGTFLRGTGLSLASGRFTAPAATVFQFSASLHVGHSELKSRARPRVQDAIHVLICISSLCHHHTTLEAVEGLERRGGVFTVPVQGLLQLQAGQYVSIFVDNGSRAHLTVQSGSSFSGLLLGA
ncbi:adipolin [Tamandua tetradactyla]|uniref:adipolin n=1 Tax=Tamandua tetradactyla TaxID=48850 RepID=UPI0040544FDB